MSEKLVVLIDFDSVFLSDPLSNDASSVFWNFGSSEFIKFLLANKDRFRLIWISSEFKSLCPFDYRCSFESSAETSFRSWGDFYIWYTETLMQYDNYHHIAEQGELYNNIDHLFNIVEWYPYKEHKSEIILSAKILTSDHIVWLEDFIIREDKKILGSFTNGAFCEVDTFRYQNALVRAQMVIQSLLDELSGMDFTFTDHTKNEEAPKSSGHPISI